MCKEIFRKPTKWRVMKGLLIKEIDDLIIGSLGIVALFRFLLEALLPFKQL